MLGENNCRDDYHVVHCTGYIKNWPPQGIQLDRSQEEDLQGSSCCLVAIGRLQVTSMPNTHDLAGAESAAEFVSRHNMEGKFTFVDQRVIQLMGYAPQELLGKCCFDFIHTEDQTHMKESFDQVVKMKGQSMTFQYRFRAKSGEWVWLRTNAFAFLNPYTDEIEYVVCTNSTAKANMGAATGLATPPEVAPTDYRQTPSSGLDYSLPQSAPAGTAPSASAYSSHLSQPPSNSQSGNATPQHQQAGPQQAQAPPVYSYDQQQTSSPAAAYGSSPGASIHRASSVGKNTPTPPQSAWSQPVGAAPATEAGAVVAAASAYQYGNLSPSRSPGVYRAPAAVSATTASASSMWHWQGNGQATGLELGHHPGAVGPPGLQSHHQPELGDMLHMLGHHSAAAAATVPHHSAAAAAAAHHHGFENLGMFTQQYQ